MLTFVERIAEQLATAQAKDAEHKKNRDPFRTYYRRHDDTYERQVPKVVKVTENYSFVPLRGWHGYSTVTEEQRRIGREGRNNHRPDGFFCVILYKDNLLLGYDNRPYWTHGGKKDGTAKCKELEAKGFTPDQWYEQTEAEYKRETEYRDNGLRLDRQQGYAKVVALRSLLNGTVLGTKSPDGLIPATVINNLLKAARKDLLTTLQRQGLVKWDDETLPVQWGGEQEGRNG